VPGATEGGGKQRGASHGRGSCHPDPRPSKLEMEPCCLDPWHPDSRAHQQPEPPPLGLRSGCTGLSVSRGGGVVCSQGRAFSTSPPKRSLAAVLSEFFRSEKRERAEGELAGSGTLLFSQGRRSRSKMTLGLKVKCQLRADS